MVSKIKTVHELTQLDIPNITLVSGVFDLIHRGHIELLEHAWQICTGKVIVGLNSDKSVQALKGPTRPINSFGSRAIIMAAFMFVDYVFEIHDKRVDEVIRKLKPRRWHKGGDYSLDTLDQGELAAAKEAGTEIILFPMVQGCSSTRIIEDMKRS